MKYSLAKYSLTITTNDSRLQEIFGESLTIGGQGSTTDSISVSQSSGPMQINAYATGGYVFSQSYDRSGTASININQVSDAVNKLKKLLKATYTIEYDPFTIVVSDNEGNQVVSCKDCYLGNSLPTQSFSESAADQTWNFICGQVTFN